MVLVLDVRLCSKRGTFLDMNQHAGIWYMAYVGSYRTHDMAYGTGAGSVVVELDR
jgi:hypothetical protein